MSERFPCWYPLQIRFRDLDPLSHVNNAVYFTYFEEARSYYLSLLERWLDGWPGEEAAPERQSGENPRIQTGPRAARYGLLVKEVSCTYELPLIRSDRAEVGVRVSHVGRTSFIMEHQIRDAHKHERIFATGRSVMVWCDYRTGRPHPLPPALRHAFEQMEGRSFPAPE
uniref:Thioesterase n=1 Tax=Thermogemmatispora argillosa TaxID=2045280 RepID=A0A455T884_9CHLR|nr:thioesterase [Thermogemmatispora argillosa]